jgi:hypothetical protein
VSGSKWHCFTANAEYVVEFREAITVTIPSLMKLVEDKYEHVRQKTAEVVRMLANHGEWQLERTHCGTTDRDDEVEFHEAIASKIPLFTKRLESEDREVRSTTVGVIVDLANHSE